MEDQPVTGVTTPNETQADRPALATICAAGAGLVLVLDAYRRARGARPPDPEFDRARSRQVSDEGQT